MLPVSGREYTHVGQTVFPLVYRVANSANFPCGGKGIVLYYIHSVMLDNKPAVKGRDTLPSKLI